MSDFTQRVCVRPKLAPRSEIEAAEPEADTEDTING